MTIVFGTVMRTPMDATCVQHKIHALYNFQNKNEWHNLQVCNNSKVELSAYTDSNRMRTP